MTWTMDVMLLLLLGGKLCNHSTDEIMINYSVTDLPLSWRLKNYFQFFSLIHPFWYTRRDNNKRDDWQNDEKIAHRTLCHIEALIVRQMATWWGVDVVVEVNWTKIKVNWWLMRCLVVDQQEWKLMSMTPNYGFRFNNSTDFNLTRKKFYFFHIVHWSEEKFLIFVIYVFKCFVCFILFHFFGCHDGTCIAEFVSLHWTF